MPMDTSTIDEIKLPELGGLTLRELRQRQAEYRALLKQAQERIPELVRYTSEERVRAAAVGSARGDELTALRSIAEAAEGSPGTVQALADRDNGDDASNFEPGLLRARLEAAALLQELREETEQAGSDLNDTSLSLGVQAKPVLLEAYGLLKPVAALNAKVGSALALALDYYRSARRPKSVRIKPPTA